MTKPLAVSAAALLGLVLASGTARAQEEPGDPSAERAAPARPRPFTFTDRPLTIDAVLGLGTPVGIIGGIVQYDVARWLALGAGAGANIAGLQLAALARLRPFTWERPWGTIGIELGGALSTGAYGGQLDVGPLISDRPPDPDEQVYSNSWLAWAQADVGFELKTRGGFHLIAAEGLGWPLNASSGHCARQDTGAPVACDPSHLSGGSYPELLNPIFTLMLGWSLDV